MKRRKNTISSAIDSALMTYLFGIAVCFAAVLHLFGIM